MAGGGAGRCFEDEAMASQAACSSSSLEMG